VNAAIEHDDCREALGAYALGALPETEADRVRRHLAECHECRAELEWLRSAVDALPASVTQVEPAPELKARLMATVEAEAALLHAAGPTADEPAPDRRTRWSPRRVWWPALGLAAAAVVALIVLLVSGPGTRTIEARITSPALAGRVHATLQLTGTTAELHLVGLPLPPANHVEELWVQRGNAAPRPSGTFLIHTGSVRVARPVQSGDQVLVTIEPGRGTTRPTGPPLLVARV
jgi:anti-sigma factor RsiW